MPIQIEIARRTLASAQADYAKAKEVQQLTRDEVDRSIDEADAALAAAKADQTLAQIEYDRYTNLFKDDAATKQSAAGGAGARRRRRPGQPRRRQTRPAQAERRKNDVAARDVEAALTATQKADKNVDLALTSNAQIRESERMRDVKKASVEEAEDELKYTQILAPFPGVVVKRYRNLGDFASPGVAVLSMYNPDLLYVTANLEETRLPGVAPGNPVRNCKWTPSPSRSGAASSGSTNRPAPVRADAAERRVRASSPRSCSACRCASGSRRTTAGRSCGPACRCA